MARRRAPATHPNHERWLISYADFITLLFALFVVMFATAQPDKSKARQVSYAVQEALEKGAVRGGEPFPVGSQLPASSPPAPKPASPQPTPVVPELMPSMLTLDRALSAEIATGKIAVHLDTRGLVISLRQAAYFPSGGDVIADSGIDSIQKIALTLRDLPNPVQLEGHTDSAPIHTRRFRSNWELSAARSIAMLELLSNRFGIPLTRLAVAGYADTKPVDSNDTPEGRAHNRRVDIVILNLRPPPAIDPLR